MDFSIASILMLDGVTNGAIYALLALATVLVFAVTRVIFIPQGEFVAFGALTLALLQTGKVPGTVWLLLDAGRLPRRCSTSVARRCARGHAGWRARRGRAAQALAFPVAVVAGHALGRAAASCRCWLQSAAHAGASSRRFGAAGLPPGLPVAGRRHACWCC